MTAIPFPVSSAPGLKPSEGAGRLINCYAEKTGEGARHPVIWRRSGGLRRLVDISAHSHFRGAILESSTLVVALNERAYAVTRSGNTYSATNLGALAGTSPITVAKNNAATPNIVCVTENGALNLFTDSAPTSFADADLPQPNSVSELNGYLLFTLGDGRIFSTELNSVSVATNSYTTEQSTGGLLRGVTFRGEFFAFGRTGTGVYRDIGASPFPLERHSFTIQTGIVGTYAVAGWEAGWVDQLIWVGDDNQVHKLNGYNAEPISTPEVVRDIAAAVEAGDGSELEASVYMQGQHAFWRLTYPDNWTWEYNATTQNWGERESFNTDDCRASGAIRAFDRWIIGDRDSGKLFQVDETYYREDNSDPLVMVLESGSPATFPSRGVVHRADFDFTVGVGVASGEDPIQTDPKVSIQFSKDGGASWSSPALRSLGGQGETEHKVSLLRVGQFKGQGVRFRLTISDPVHVGFMGGQMAMEARGE